MDTTKCIKEVFSKAVSDITDLEIWSGYYQLRYEEFIHFLPLFPSGHLDQVLEIGCGMGYQSAMLACISNNVIASDVNFGQMKKHSRGIDLTREFIRRLGKKNVEVVVADVQQLPFADESFDFVYCSYSFQYVPDKKKALREIRRVLKKEGCFFCIVPTSVHTIRINFSHYAYLFKRIFKKDNPGATDTAGMISANSSNRKRTWKDYLKKMLPATDDADTFFLKELFSRLPFKWKRLFRSGYYSVKAIPVSSRHHFISRFCSAGLILIAKKI